MRLIHGAKPRRFKKYVDWRKQVTIKDLAIERTERFADPCTYGFITRVQYSVKHNDMCYTEVVDIPEGCDGGSCLINHWREKYCK